MAVKYKINAQLPPRADTPAELDKIRILLSKLEGFVWVDGFSAEYKTPRGAGTFQMRINRGAGPAEKLGPNIEFITTQPADSIETILKTAFNITLRSGGEVYDPQIGIFVTENNIGRVLNNAYQIQLQQENKTPQNKAKSVFDWLGTAIWIILVLIGLFAKGCGD